MTLRDTSNTNKIGKYLLYFTGLGILVCADIICDPKFHYMTRGLILTYLFMTWIVFVISLIFKDTV